MKNLYIIHTDKDYHTSDNEHILVIAADNENEALDVAIHELGVDFCDWDDSEVIKIPHSRNSKLLHKIF